MRYLKDPVSSGAGINGNTGTREDVTSGAALSPLQQACARSLFVGAIPSSYNSWRERRSRRPRINRAPVAQWREQRIPNPCVASSILARGSIYKSRSGDISPGLFFVGLTARRSHDHNMTTQFTLTCSVLVFWGLACVKATPVMALTTPSGVIISR